VSLEKLDEEKNKRKGELQQKGKYKTKKKRNVNGLFRPSFHIVSGGLISRRTTVKLKRNVVEVVSKKKETERFCVVSVSNIIMMGYGIRLRGL